MLEMCLLLQVKQFRILVYHPQTNGLIEHFNQTLKRMFGRVVEVDRWNWDLLLPYILFTVRETPQPSTGFTRFKLLFRRSPRGLLNVACEAWEEQPSPLQTVVEYIREMWK